MQSKLMNLEEAKKVLSGSGVYMVAADNKVINQLPKGNWIGGTIPYFMASEGGVIDQNRVFITELPSSVQFKDIRFCDEGSIASVYQKIPQNGLGMIIIPALTSTHLSFAVNARNYKEFAQRPLVGWIAGAHLNELSTVKPKVINGLTGEVSESKAIVMNLALAANYYCDVGIVNIFDQGSGDTLEFPESGFEASHVLVNGKQENFADYVVKNKINIKLPLVADYAGAKINVSFQNIDEKARKVSFYAPVFQGVSYRQAGNVADYIGRFSNELPKDSSQIAFSCNCILNFLYSELEGKKTSTITGPITFGEIAYQLLNQTMVYLTIGKS